MTGGLSSLVYAITQAGQNGWGSAETLGVFAARSCCSPPSSPGSFAHPEPLMRFGILRTRTVSGANVAGFILGTALFSMFLMLTLYMQQVLGYSAMKTGVAYLAVAGTAIVWSAVAGQLVTRVGVKPVLVAGMAMLTAGLLYFTQVSVGGSYVGDLLPGLPDHRRRDRVLLRADLDRGAGGRRGGRGRARVGADQHLAADRWRARHRRALHDRHVAHEDSLARRVGPARRAGRRVLVGVPGRCAIAALGVVAALALIRRDELAQAPQVEAEALPMAA